MEATTAKLQPTMRGLGHLEAAVMEVLWAASGPLTVRGVLDAMPERSLAYTTIMTVLENLHRKHFLERVKHVRAYHYQPALTRGQAWAGAMRDLLHEARDAETVLLHFASTVSDDESEVLRTALNRRQRQP